MIDIKVSIASHGKNLSFENFSSKNLDHKNNFQELLDQDITKEFCWENKPMKRYLNSFDSN